MDEFWIIVQFQIQCENSSHFSINSQQLDPPELQQYIVWRMKFHLTAMVFKEFLILDRSSAEQLCNWSTDHQYCSPPQHAWKLLTWSLLYWNSEEFLCIWPTPAVGFELYSEKPELVLVFAFIFLTYTFDSQCVNLQYGTFHKLQFRKIAEHLSYSQTISLQSDIKYKLNYIIYKLSPWISHICTFMPVNSELFYTVLCKYCFFDDLIYMFWYILLCRSDLFV